MNESNQTINNKSAIELCDLIVNEVKKTVKGKDDIIRKILLAILAKGHILLEDIPGVGKTTIALAFSKSMQLKYNRIQFTPDVMPSDITGFSIYKKSTEQFSYVSGAILCNLFLADEINRTSSKTQSALLEVMEESKVTVDLKTYETPKPFTVIATQNPLNFAGTQMLPESQLDRFLIKLSIGYPSKNDEIDILRSKNINNVVNILPVVSAEDVLKMQEDVEKVFVHDLVYEYMVNLAYNSRIHPLLELGLSPRGTVSLMKASQAKAYMSGRDYVIPEDVQSVFIDVSSHRIILKHSARASKLKEEDVLNEIIENTKAPKIKM